MMYSGRVAAVQLIAALAACTDALHVAVGPNGAHLLRAARHRGGALVCLSERSGGTDDDMPFSRMDDALSWLHSRAAAAREQQGRLRKGDAVASPSACYAVDGEEEAEARDEPATVYLVGVGPGDVELLTVKALRLMREADLVLYDRLIAPEILELVGDDASMLYVGKEAGLHTRPQEEIHQLLYHFAESGKTVVRLKGGDPTVFGRGGEEMEYLETQGVRVRVVPGITAASGIAASLGVPLTHRDHADSVRFITGHARSECSLPVEERYPWHQLADPKTTLVIYMGLSTLPDLAAGLVGAGLDPSTPAVAVQDGTTPTQRLVAARLDELPAQVEEAGLRSPTLVVIGSVVPSNASLVAQIETHPLVGEFAFFDGSFYVGFWREPLVRGPHDQNPLGANQPPSTIKQGQGGKGQQDLSRFRTPEACRYGERCRHKLACSRHHGPDPQAHAVNCACEEERCPLGHPLRAGRDRNSVAATATQPTGKRPPPGYVCAKCKAREEHYLNECPQNVCYRCGKQGHIATHCTNERISDAERGLKRPPPSGADDGGRGGSAPRIEPPSLPPAPSFGMGLRPE